MKLEILSQTLQEILGQNFTDLKLCSQKTFLKESLYLQEYYRDNRDSINRTRFDVTGINEDGSFFDVPHNSQYRSDWGVDEKEWDFKRVPELECDFILIIEDEESQWGGEKTIKLFSAPDFKKINNGEIVKKEQEIKTWLEEQG